MAQDANRVHRAAQVAEGGGARGIVPVEARPPRDDEVRVDVVASGICGADIGALDVRASSVVLHAEHVVLAVPPALALSHIEFDPEPPPDLARLARRTPVWMVTVAKVVVRYSTAFWRGE
ncbi:FAD-dependent oxidoreductase [Streptomyces fuscichromogenes]|uniref:Amine oxidase domain-containing protein n=1 Tax=Streptomyces fuscichromogenes TaxID=1324013 RepID=A0A918CTN7_9ACTN|nr:FAD-dependent oxidoreductase [Streptomyces fuscichromogenes]GGN22205.1 hypothetical protein GCM10011578_053850 [Streptomyces fuscichromogenes]